MSGHDHFKRTPGFLATFHLTQMVGISTNFHSLILWGLLFPTPVLRAEEPCVALRLLAL